MARMCLPSNSRHVFSSIVSLSFLVSVRCRLASSVSRLSKKRARIATNKASIRPLTGLFSLFETRFTRKPVGLPDVGSPTKRLRNHAHYRRREIRVLPPQPPHLPRIGNSCRRTSLIRFSGASEGSPCCGRRGFRHFAGVVVYSPYRDVSWSVSFQETEKRTLTRDIAKIVKSIEGSTEVVQQEILEAAHRAELRQQQWEAQQERWSREEDQRQIAKSISDSREQLNQIIQAWTKTLNIEQFLKGVEERASNLSEAEREVVQERLRLAREFIGAQDPFEFLRAWKSPSERYVPLATGTS